jgi:hypothetical protein
VIRAEAALQEEVMLRLRALRPRCVIVPTANGVWLPARTPAERVLASDMLSPICTLPRLWHISDVSMKRARR